MSRFFMGSMNIRPKVSRNYPNPKLGTLFPPLRDETALGEVKVLTPLVRGATREKAASTPTLSRKMRNTRKTTTRSKTSKMRRKVRGLFVRESLGKNDEANRKGVGQPDRCANKGIAHEQLGRDKRRSQGAGGGCGKCVEYRG